MDTWRGEDFLTFIKLLQAKCTNKVFGVEFPELLKEHESEKNWLWQLIKACLPWRWCNVLWWALSSQRTANHVLRDNESHSKAENKWQIYKDPGSEDMADRLTIPSWSKNDPP